MPPLSPATAFHEALAEAAQTALSHPLRSGLGALAMAVAVATVAIVSTALEGVTVFARATAARTFGSDAFVLAQIAERGRLSRRQLEDKLARNPTLRRSDLRFLGRWSGDEVLYAGVAQRAADVMAGGRKFEAAAVTGTGPALADIRDLGLERGRFLNQDDDARAAPVAVIGRDLADQLFPGDDAVGRPIRLAGRRFEVIGVQGRLGTAGGASLDRSVWIPLATWERTFGAPQSLELFARARDTRLTSAAEDRARVTLRALRRLLPGVPDNFDILTPEAARGFVAALTGRISAAAGPLSAMALLAAMVVVANTTLVSVSQRTREIGVRRALGATRRQVMREVLVESALVAVVGGAAGLLVVLAISQAVAGWSRLPVALAPATAAWSLGSAGLAGLLAGLYPARRAAHIDIVQAVRAE